MDRKATSILGVPVDQLTVKEVIETIFLFIDDYQSDKKPRYVATINTDFIFQANSCRKYDSKHPELLNILRGADLATLDGMPLLWVSKLLKCRTPERITGADLVPALIKEASIRDKSCFFIGGSQQLVENAAKLLQTEHLNLKVVGCISPKISISGENLVDSLEEDRELVRQINHTKPDLLFIGLGNPKQEIWFERIKEQLEVPVSIGIGGTFNFITKNSFRAPSWMQHIGMEWFYRLLQEPKRLLKRYALGLVKFPFLFIPVVYEYWKYSLLSPKNTLETKNLEFSTFLYDQKKELKVIIFPELVTEKIFRQVINNKEKIIFNFSHTKSILPEALGSMLNFFVKKQSIKDSFFCHGISKSLKKMFKRHRMWDLIEPHYYVDTQLLVGYIVKIVPMDVMFSVSKKECSIIYFFGILKNKSIEKALALKFDDVGNKGILYIDLTYCNFIDNSGIAFLLKMSQKFKGQVKIINPQESIIKVLKIAGVFSTFCL